MNFTVLGVKVMAFKGSTAWEGQVGPFWFSVSQLRFWWTIPVRDILHFGRELD